MISPNTKQEPSQMNSSITDWLDLVGLTLQRTSPKLDAGFTPISVQNLLLIVLPSLELLSHARAQLLQIV